MTMISCAMPSIICMACIVNVARDQPRIVLEILCVVFTHKKLLGYSLGELTPPQGESMLRSAGRRGDASKKEG